MDKSFLDHKDKTFFGKLAFAIVFVISIVACLYHLGTGIFGLLTAFKQRTIHLAMIGTVARLMEKEGRK